LKKKITKDELINDLVAKYGANSIRVVWFKELVKNTHKADYIYRTYKALMNGK
jgi:hypothetical protein